MKRVVLTTLVILAALAIAQEKDPEEAPAVTAARGQVAGLRADLEKLRGARFRADVPVRGETVEAFKKSIVEDLDKDFPETKARPCSRALGRLGLVPAGYDIRKGIIDAGAETTLAYYDTEKKYFAIVSPEDMVGDEGKSTIVHELTHALQDQRFNLDHYDKALRGDDDDDAALARTFVIEGEATFIENKWLLRDQPEKLPAKLDELVSAHERELRRIAKLREKGAALEKGDELPLYYYRSAWEPYSTGAKLVAAVFEKGGWKAVDELFTKPPQSTAQCLHPRKLLEQQDPPVRVSLPDLGPEIGEGWKKSFESTLGELGVHCFLVERGAKDDADQAAEGWAGDRLLAFEKEGEPTALVWFTTWDTARDAEEFEAAAAKVEKKDPRAGENLLARREKVVVLVEGAPRGRAQALLDAALEKAKTSR